MDTNIKLKPGASGIARVEFLACREAIENLRNQGYTARAIHAHFTEKGYLTCSYSAFCDYLRGEGKRSHSKKKHSPQHPKPVAKSGGPIIVNVKTETFPDPRKMDIKDAI